MIDRYTITEDSSDETRMAALIHCCLRIDPDGLDDETFFKLWGRTKFFMELAYQVKFQS